MSVNLRSSVLRAHIKFEQYMVMCIIRISFLYGNTPTITLPAYTYDEYLYLFSNYRLLLLKIACGRVNILTFSCDGRQSKITLRILRQWSHQTRLSLQFLGQSHNPFRLGNLSEFFIQIQKVLLNMHVQ